MLDGNTLDPSICRATGNNGKWTKDEDRKLKDSTQIHGGKDWDSISALVPCRTKSQCKNRWHYALDPSLLDGTTRRTGTWIAMEDIKLKDAVQTHGDKDWGAIAALVPRRTKDQCRHRWHRVLNPSIDQAIGRMGKWVEY
jgi:hypothetical protein